MHEGNSTLIINLTSLNCSVRRSSKVTSVVIVLVEGSIGEISVFVGVAVVKIALIEYSSSSSNCTSGSDINTIVTVTVQ